MIGFYLANFILQIKGLLYVLYIHILIAHTNTLIYIYIEREIRWEYLKENKVDEVEEEAGPVEPEELIIRLNHWGTFNHLSSLLNP